MQRISAPRNPTPRRSRRRGRRRVWAWQLSGRPAHGLLWLVGFPGVLLLLHLQLALCHQKALVPAYYLADFQEELVLMKSALLAGVLFAASILPASAQYYQHRAHVRYVVINRYRVVNHVVYVPAPAYNAPYYGPPYYPYRYSLVCVIGFCL